MHEYVFQTKVDVIILSEILFQAKDLGKTSMQQELAFQISSSLIKLSKEFRNIFDGLE